MCVWVDIKGKRRLTKLLRTDNLSVAMSTTANERSKLDFISKKLCTKKTFKQTIGVTKRIANVVFFSVRSLVLTLAA